MSKPCGRIKKAEMRDIIQSFTEILSRFDWLFVCIDSSRGESLTSNKEYWDRYVGGNNLRVAWTPVGFIVPKSDILSAAKIENNPFIVNFSGAYLFDDASRLDEWPNFSGTGDSWDFDELISSQLVNDVRRCSAAAYFCDGMGVNYFLSDSTIQESLNRAGFFDL